MIKLRPEFLWKTCRCNINVSKLRKSVDIGIILGFSDRLLVTQLGFNIYSMTNCFWVKNYQWCWGLCGRGRPLLPPPPGAPPAHGTEPSPPAHHQSSVHTMDQISMKTPNLKCRLHWSFLEFIDWRYSRSCWYFWPFLWTSAPLTFSLVHLPSPPSCVNKYSGMYSYIV